MHDLLVVLLQHHGVAVAEDAGFGQDVDRKVPAGRLHPLFEFARARDPFGCAVGNDIDDRYFDEFLETLI